MKFITRLVLLSLIFIVGSFLRLHNVHELPPGLYPDEAMNANNAVETLATGDYRLFYPENNGREGLFVHTIALSLSIFQVYEPWVVRLPSIIFGIATILAIYLLTRELLYFSDPTLRDVAALASALFVATSFWHINFSRIAFRAIMAPLFFTLGSYLFFRAKRMIESHCSALQVYGTYLFAGLVFGFGMHSYIAYRIAPLVFLVLSVAFFAHRPRAHRTHLFVGTGMFFLGIALISAPLVMHFLAYPDDFLGRTSQLSIFSSDAPIRALAANILLTIGMLFVRGDFNWRHNIAGEPVLYWFVGLLLVLGVAIGVLELWRRRNEKYHLLAHPFSFLFMSSALMMLPVVISNEGIPHALRSIMMIPPLYIIAGIGFAYALHAMRPYRFVRAVTLSLVITLSVLSGYIYYFSIWGQQDVTAHAFTQHYVELAQQIEYTPVHIPKYVLITEPGVIVRGIPMPAQTIMFLTDSFMEDRRSAKNIHYITSKDQIPSSQSRYLLFSVQHSLQNTTDDD